MNDEETPEAEPGANPESEGEPATTSPFEDPELEPFQGDIGNLRKDEA
jgi:hypothetical protein